MKSKRLVQTLFASLNINQLVLMVLSLCLSACVGTTTKGNDNGNKPEFKIERLSIQSHKILYNGDPSVTEEQGLKNWTKKAHELCPRKAKLTVLRNEQVNYVVSAKVNTISANPVRDQFCTPALIDCAIAMLVIEAMGDSDEPEYIIASVTEGYTKSYRVVEGQLFCP